MYTKWNILLACCESEYEVINSRGPKSSSGYTGVTMNGCKFRSVIYIDGKQVYLGAFGSAEEASKAHQVARMNKILNNY